MSIPRDQNHPGAPLHPGEMLREEFMMPLGLSAKTLALALKIPLRQISDLLGGRRSITADMAYRLARYFGMPAQFWMDLRINYELAIMYKHAESVIAKEVQPRVA